MAGLTHSPCTLRQNGCALTDRQLAVAFGLALASALIGVSHALFRDADTYWHVHIGKWIWATGSVPWTDEFSYTFAGHPWIAKEWLAQLILFGAYAAGGWNGVALATVAAISLSSSILLLFVLRYVRWTIALSISIAAVILMSSHFVARPHILAYPPLILWLAGLLTAAERAREPHWTLALLMVLWANLHGGFTIGFIWAVLLAGEAVVASSPANRISVALGWARFILMSIAAACVSPYGYHGFLVTVRLFGSGESLPFITEWQPLQFDLLGVVCLSALAAAMLALATRPRQNLFRILLVAFVGYMMVRHSRFGALFGVTAAMVTAAAIARRFPDLTGPDGHPGGTLDLIWSRRIFIGFVPGALVAALLLLALKDPRPDDRITPAAALEAAQRHELAGPVYNSYNFGGYLIFRGIPTFIDGRSDQLFLDGFISTLGRSLATDNARAFLAILERYGVTWALVPVDSPEAPRLASSSTWQKVHEDAVAAVFVRR